MTELRAAALAVLRENDLGRWTKPAPRLYPHQWSWDSAFIAMGLVQEDPPRARQELRTLFDAQWSNGMVPHIIFNPEAAGYFPDPARWGTDRAENAPRHVKTSGLCQPPVHALAVMHLHRKAPDLDFLREMFPRLLAWHRFLLTDRDPRLEGLVTIYHPWESGLDNSPRWDEPLAAVAVGEVPPYQRHDLQHVADAAQRPTAAEYDRYLWLMECLKKVNYHERKARTHHPFQVKDVLMSAILAAANEALLEVAAILKDGVHETEIRTWIERGRRGVESCWDDAAGLCFDYDARFHRPIPSRTVAGFAPLLFGGGAHRERLVEHLLGPAFAGHPDLRWPVPPSTSPLDAAFRPRAYWRGPTWPVMTWLLAWGLERSGAAEAAAAMRRAGLDALAGGDFAEYYEPFTGEPLGSLRQSWTAAVALDWMKEEDDERD